MNEPPVNSQRLLWGVMLAVLVWGTLLAIGAGLFGINRDLGGVQFAPNPLRGGIVFACVAGFLGLWALALRARANRS